MARLSFGFMVLLLTCSKIALANVLSAPDELTEKLNVNGDNDSTYTGTLPSIEKSNILKSEEQNEGLNKFAKRSIDYSRDNQLYNNNNNYNYYNPPSPQSSAEIRPPNPYSFFSLWQPQHHQIDRPYYIPVFRGPGGSAIIFPPQPSYNYFGYPPDNPPNNAYLPPNNVTPSPCSNGSTTIDNRFAEPVWGIIPGSPSPTRPPGAQSTTAPSLIHNINDVDSQTPSSTTPATTTTSSNRPQSPSAGLPPSRCVWSIVTCCQSTTTAINYKCFEDQGCSGAFWDENPCDVPNARAALESIMKYFGTQ